MSRVVKTVLVCWLLSGALLAFIHLSYGGSRVWTYIGTPRTSHVAAGYAIALLQAIAGLTACIAARPRAPGLWRIGYWVLLVLLAGVVSVLTFPGLVLALGVMALFVAPPFGLSLIGLVCLWWRRFMR